MGCAFIFLRWVLWEVDEESLMVRLNTQQGNGEAIPFEVGRTLLFISGVVPRILCFTKWSVRVFRSSWQSTESLSDSPPRRVTF